MTIRIVRLGSARTKDEGIRIGTVRRPPRGVTKPEFASQNWYDVWFPTLAPSVETMKRGQAAETPAQWADFIKKYRAEMSKPEASHALELLARLSHSINFSVWVLLRKRSALPSVCPASTSSREGRRSRIASVAR